MFFLGVNKKRRNLVLLGKETSERFQNICSCCQVLRQAGRPGQRIRQKKIEVGDSPVFLAEMRLGRGYAAVVLQPCAPQTKI